MSDLPAQDCRQDSSTSQPWWRQRAEWAYDSFVSGRLRDHDAPTKVEHDVSRETIGTLALPGGRFVAADPYVMGGEVMPFVQVLGSEEAEVVAVRALVGPDHERVAALVLVGGRSTIVDWTMATVAGQDVSHARRSGLEGLVRGRCRHS